MGRAAQPVGVWSLCIFQVADALCTTRRWVEAPHFGGTMKPTKEEIAEAREYLAEIIDNPGFEYPPSRGVCKTLIAALDEALDALQRIPVRLRTQRQLDILHRNGRL